MDLITILRDLWRYRRLVPVLAALAMLIGLASAYRVTYPPFKVESRQYLVGLATASVLVDTPDSQVVDVDPEGTDTLGLRANLLASLMAETELSSAIARKAGMRPDDLIAIAETPTSPETPLPKGDLSGTSVLTVRPDETLPFIKINAHASNAQQAAVLANAAMDALEDYLDSKAAEERVTNGRRLVVSRLGPARSGEVVRGPRRLIALLVAVFFFLAACVVIVGGIELARRWRLAAAEQLPDDELAVWPDELDPEDPAGPDLDLESPVDDAEVRRVARR
jgi:hypothetical protein